MTGQFETGVFEAAWRYRVMVATITLLAVSLSFTAGTALEPATSATATIGLRTPRSNNVIAPGTQGDATLGRYTAQRSRFVTSDEVLTSVAHSIGEDDAADLRSRIHVQPSLTSNTLSIRAEGATADDAVDLALSRAPRPPGSSCSSRSPTSSRAEPSSTTVSSSSSHPPRNRSSFQVSRSRRSRSVSCSGWRSA
jgi:hypothetical protein